MVETRPFTAFSFSVELTLKDEKDFICNASFSECDGLEITMEPKTIREGGNNNHPIHLIGPVSYGQLSLKRGMTDCLDLFNWFNRVTQQEKGLRASGEIVLLASKLTEENEENTRKDRLRFILEGCLPVKLKAPALNAKDGQLAIEEMTIAYESLEFKNPET
jgi:phage tail-like protein